MIGFGTNGNFLGEYFLRESDLILLKAISAGHTAEETLKHAGQIRSLTSERFLN